MSQYNTTIMYIRGEDNTVTDTLSRLPLNTFPDEQEDAQPHERWMRGHSANAILSITSDQQVLNDIKMGYKTDKFC